MPRRHDARTHAVTRPFATKGRLRRASLAVLVVCSFVPVLLAGGSVGGAVSSVPDFDHIFVIAMENHSYGNVMGSSQAPYLNSLAAGGALLTNDYGVAHPSLPNYLAWTGGSTFGVTQDCVSCYVGAVPNIASDRIEPSGRSWKAYMESMPSSCDLSETSLYAVRHNPFLYYDDIRTNAAECARDVPYSQLSGDLASVATTPSFGWISPNLCDDMHDCSVAAGDSWLQANVPVILSSPAFTSQRSLLVVTFDEDDGTQNNQIATVLVGAGIAPGTQSSVHYDHYSLLKTIETAWSLAPLTTNDANAQPISDIFTNPPTTVPTTHPATTTTGPIIGPHRIRRPDAPTVVSASSNWTDKGTGSLTVRWRTGADNGSAITRFTVACSSSNGGVRRVAVHHGAAARRLVVGRLSTRKAYSCRVTETNAAGRGPVSRASARVVVGAPAPPAGSHPVRVAAGRFKVSFSPGANNGAPITAYVALCTSSDGGVRRTAGRHARPVVVKGLTHGKWYRCTVIARNRRGDSRPSRASAAVRA